MIDRMSYLQAKGILEKKEAIVTREKKQGEVSAVNILEIFK